MAAMIPIPGNQVTIYRDDESEPFASVDEQPDGTWMVTADCHVDGHVYQTVRMAVRAVLDAIGIREEGTSMDPVEMARRLRESAGEVTFHG